MATNIDQLVQEIQRLTARLQEAKREGVARLRGHGVDEANVSQSILDLYRLIDRAGGGNGGETSFTELIRVLEELSFSIADTEQFDYRDGAIVAEHVTLPDDINEVRIGASDSCECFLEDKPEPEEEEIEDE